MPTLPWTHTWMAARWPHDPAPLLRAPDPAVALRAQHTADADLAADLATLERARQTGGRGTTAFDLPRALARPDLAAEALRLSAPLAWAVPPDGDPTFEGAGPEHTALVLSDDHLVVLDSARLNRYHREGTLHLALGARAADVERAHAALIAGEPSDLFLPGPDGWRLRDDLWFAPTPSLLEPDLALLFHRRDGSRQLRIAVGADGLSFFGELLPALRRTTSLATLRARFGGPRWRMVEQLVAEGVLVATPRTAPQPPAGGRARLLAHSAVLIESPGARLLVDPMLTVRSRPSFNPLSWLDRPLDAVAITHSHWDHFNLDGLLHIDRGARVLLPRRHHPTTLVQLDMAALCRQLGFRDVVELGPWEQATVGDQVFTALPYFGEGFGPECPRDWLTFHVRAAGRSVAGLVDACRDDFGDMDDVMPEVRRRLGPVDVLFAPASDFRYPTLHFTRRPFHLDGATAQFTGGPADAVRWAAACDAGVLVPYALFHTEPGDVDADDAAAAADPFRHGRLRDVVAGAGTWPDGRTVVLRPGEGLGWTGDTAPHPIGRGW